MKIILNLLIAILPLHALLLHWHPYWDFFYGFCYGDYGSPLRRILYQPFSEPYSWLLVFIFFLIRAGWSFYEKVKVTE